MLETSRDSTYEKSDRKISAPATLETPQHRNSFLPKVKQGAVVEEPAKEAIKTEPVKSEVFVAATTVLHH